MYSIFQVMSLFEPSYSTDTRVMTRSLCILLLAALDLLKSVLLNALIDRLGVVLQARESLLNLLLALGTPAALLLDSVHGDLVALTLDSSLQLGPTTQLSRRHLCAWVEASANHAITLVESLGDDADEAWGVAISRVGLSGGLVGLFVVEIVVGRLQGHVIVLVILAHVGLGSHGLGGDDIVQEPLLLGPRLLVHVEGVVDGVCGCEQVFGQLGC